MDFYPKIYFLSYRKIIIIFTRLCLVVSGCRTYLYRHDKSIRFLFSPELAGLVHLSYVLLNFYVILPKTSVQSFALFTCFTKMQPKPVK